MSIDKLSEFAVNGDKSISGLTLTTGFPRQQKPYRQWMNYLFNMVTAKTNQLVDEVNALNQKVTPLLTPIRVGELFVTTTDYTSAAQVAERHGYGTWQRFAEGKTLVGYSAQSGELDEYRIMGNEFGENEHLLTTQQIPEHEHIKKDYDSNNPTGNRMGGTMHYGEAGQGSFQGNVTSGKAGGNQPHNNIQPSIVVAYWLRVG